jgi:hypothetical protein
MIRLLIALGLSCAAVSASAAQLPLDTFIDKGHQVVALARQQGLAAAQRIFADPKNGFLDLDGPGLHVWATDRHGVILFDFSGQTVQGTDISKWANEEGTVLMDMIGQRIDSPAGTLIERFKGVPHPRTNQIEDVDFLCGRVEDEAIVCATFWPDAGRS